MNEDLVKLKMICQAKGFEELFDVKVHMMVYEVENEDGRTFIYLDREEKEN